MGGHGILLGCRRPVLRQLRDAAQGIQRGIDQRIVPPGFAMTHLPEHRRCRDAVTPCKFAQGQAAGGMIEVVAHRIRQPMRQVFAGSGDRPVVHVSPVERPMDVYDPLAQPKLVLVSGSLTKRRET